MRKTAILDIDDILLDFNGKFISLYNQEYSRDYPSDPLPMAPGYAPRTWGFSELENRGQVSVRRVMDKTIDCNDLKAFPGANKLLRDLESMGWEIHFITAHPHHHYRARLENLFREQLDAYQTIHFSASYDSYGTKHSVSKFDVAHYNSLVGDVTIFADDNFMHIKPFLETPGPKTHLLTMDFEFNRSSIPKDLDPNITLDVAKGICRYSMTKDLYDKIRNRASSY